MTEIEKDKFIKQLQEEVGQWHHAYDALMIERNQLVSRILELEHKLEMHEKDIGEFAKAIAMKNNRIDELEESLRNVFIRTR